MWVYRPKKLISSDHRDSSVVYLSTVLGLARDSQWLCGYDFLVIKRVFMGEVNHGSFGKLRTELAQHK
jgi:hypothetical protein